MLELAVLGLLKERPMHGYDLRKSLRGEFGLLASLSFGSLYPALARLEAAGAVHEVASGGREGSTGRGGTGSESRDGAGKGPATSRSGRPPSAIPFTGSLSGELAAFKARLAQRANGSVGGQYDSSVSETDDEQRQPRRSSTRSRKVYEITPSGEKMFETLLSAEPTAGEDGRTFAVRWAFARHLPPSSRLQLLDRRRRQLESRLSDMQRRDPSGDRPLDRFERSILEHSNDQIRLDLDWIEHLISTEQAEQAEHSLVAHESTTEAS